MEVLNFEIKGKQYQTLPTTVGSMIDLWKIKMVLSGGTYGQMYKAALINADEALKAIDIEAFFMVFCPSFLKSADFKPVSISNMGIEDYLELRDIYDTQILPYLEKVEQLLKKSNDK